MVLQYPHRALLAPRVRATLEHLLDDEALGRRLAANARERQEREFVLAAAVRRTAALYEELFGASRRGARAPASRSAHG